MVPLLSDLITLRPTYLAFKALQRLIVALPNPLIPFQGHLVSGLDTTKNMSLALQ